MSFKVRPTKFRHVFGSATKKPDCYEGIKVTKTAHDSMCCAINPLFIAIVTESSGGGAFLVLKHAQTGRVDINHPKVAGHRGPVMDIKWNPFDDHVIASGSEDCTVKVWRIPDGGLGEDSLTECEIDLRGHQKKVSYVQWHPTAANVLLSTAYDFRCIVWNVERAEPICIVETGIHTDTVFSICWSYDGTKFITTCKDKKIRIFDGRTGQLLSETQGHLGSKASKAVSLKFENRLITTGFSRMSEREIAVWDVENMSEPLKRELVDSSNGVITPFYDADTGVVFLAGKGDGNIRFYEITNEKPYIYFLNQYTSGFPQRSLGYMPKRGIEAKKCEIAKFYKLYSTKPIVEPISMIVPRKLDGFQDDIFPETHSSCASLTVDEWIAGLNRERIMMSLKDGSLAEGNVITTYQKSPLPPKTPVQAPKPASLKNIEKLSCDVKLANNAALASLDNVDNTERPVSNFMPDKYTISSLTTPSKINGSQPIVEDYAPRDLNCLLDSHRENKRQSSVVEHQRNQNGQFQNQQYNQFQQSTCQPSNQFQQSTCQPLNQFQQSTCQPSNALHPSPPLNQFKISSQAKSVSSKQFQPPQQQLQNQNDKFSQPLLDHSSHLSSTAIPSPRAASTTTIPNTSVNHLSSNTSVNHLSSNTSVNHLSSKSSISLAPEAEQSNASTLPQHDFSPPSRSDIDKLPDSIIYDNVDFGNCRSSNDVSSSSNSAATISSSSIPSYSSFKDYDNPFATRGSSNLPGKPRLQQQPPPAVSTSSSSALAPLHSAYKPSKSAPSNPPKRNSYPLLVNTSDRNAPLSTSTTTSSIGSSRQLCSSQTPGQHKRNSFPASTTEGVVYQATNLDGVVGVYDNVVLRGGVPASAAGGGGGGVPGAARAGSVGAAITTGSINFTPPPPPPPPNQPNSGAFKHCMPSAAVTTGAGGAVRFPLGSTGSNLKANNNNNNNNGFTAGSVAKVSPYIGTTSSTPRGGGGGSGAGAGAGGAGGVSQIVAGQNANQKICRPSTEVATHDQSANVGQQHYAISKQLNQAIDDLEKINFNSHETKKTWSPLTSQLSNGDTPMLPNTNSELRRLYFEQQKEIACLKELLTTKDARIASLLSKLDDQMPSDSQC